MDEIIKTTDFIAINQLKLTSAELSRIKIEAEIRAKKIWKSATGALA